MYIKFAREEEVRVYELDANLAKLISLAVRPSHKIQVVKIVRDMTGFGLCETKHIVDALEIADYITKMGMAIVRVSRSRDLPVTAS